MPEFWPDLWPHQRRGIDAVLQAMENGYRHICLTSPTGGGKTRIMSELIERWVWGGLRVAVYTDRRMLLDQLSAAMTDHGIEHGRRAAGHAADERCQVQLCSIQTEHSRVHRRFKRSLFPADRVVWDEAHRHNNPVARRIRDEHHEAGAYQLGITATPIDLGGLYDTLIVAGTPSELLKGGVLVPLRHYAADEPDMRGIKGIQEGKDLNEKQADRAMRRPGLIGRLWDHFQKINPDRRPTLVFGPSVACSIWIAEQFTARGVRAAHLDGERIWVDGRTYSSSQHARAELLEQSKDGRLPIITNRFIAREGLDLPWLSHLIIATIFGSLQSYLQAVGRVLRRYPDKTYATAGDHGGNWHRFGSVAADREWQLGETNHMLVAKRVDALRCKKLSEPLRCPVCGRVLNYPACRQEHGGCGWVASPGFKRSRPVVTAEGELREVGGAIFRPHRAYAKPDGAKLWESMYHRSCTEKGRKTFRQAFALFARENNWGWPDPRWPFMPLDPDDQFNYVADVPRERLVPKPPTTQAG